MTGMFATSKAGHDKDKLYIILREDNEYVYLADGSLKTVDAPKKKRRKHIQLIHKTCYQILHLEENRKLSNEEIKRAIKLYKHELIQEV